MMKVIFQCVFDREPTIAPVTLPLDDVSVNCKLADLMYRVQPFVTFHLLKMNISLGGKGMQSFTSVFLWEIASKNPIL